MSPFDPAWAGDDGQPARVFCDAVWSAALLAVDPAGLGGVVVRAWSGPARDGFLAGLRAMMGPVPVRKLPLNVADDQLLGGLDLVATLQAGRPVVCAGLLAEAAGGLLVLAMAERVKAGTAARLATAADAGGSFAMVALDEGMDADEVPPAVLLERLALTVRDLPGHDAAWLDAEVVLKARRRLAGVVAPPEMVERICGLTVALGVDSVRAALFAVRAARAAAALAGRAVVTEDDVALAARLVLAPRANCLPAPTAALEEMASPEERQSQSEGADALEDRTTEAAGAKLPPELLAALAAATGMRRMPRGAGKGGDALSLKRGRPAGVRRGALGGGARLAILETLRAAAPWQALRRRETARNIVIRADDFRVRKFKAQARSIAIFAVDASGSSALNRLGEAKGAIQLLLAECYVRRDQVALLAFRGQGATCLLPPTGALARAKRALAALPGGGPTPLSSGIAAGRAMAEAERRRGLQPLLVLLTDGGANIGKDGGPGRAAAAADALAAARGCKGAGIAALVVDTATRPQAFVAQLAAAMGAKYLALPYADAAGLSRAVQAAS